MLVLQITQHGDHDMNLKNKEKLKIARKQSHNLIKEIKNALGNEWRISFRSNLEVIDEDGQCCLLTKESILGFKKAGMSYGIRWRNIPLPLTIDLFINFARASQPIECEDDGDEVMNELSKTLSAYFLAKQLNAELKTNQDHVHVSLKV